MEPILNQERLLQQLKRLLLQPTLRDGEQAHEPQYGLDVGLTHHLRQQGVSDLLWALSVVDQVLELVALFVVKLCVLLFDVVADIAVHVAEGLGDRDVHLFDFLDVCLQLLDVGDSALALVCR